MADAIKNRGARTGRLTRVSSIVIAAAILAISLTLLLRSRPNSEPAVDPLAWQLSIRQPATSTASSTDSSTADRVATNDATEIRQPGRSTDGGASQLAPYRVYENRRYGFVVSIPHTMTATELPEGETGTAILFQVGNDNARGFQVYVSPFDESLSVMTPERIREDLPDLPVIEPQEAVLSDGVRALIFFTDDSGLGRTREAWIIGNGNLYQITAPAAFDGELARIMGTWRFTK